MSDDAQHGAPTRADYEVKKGEVSLAVYRKRLPPAAGEAPRPVLFLVHGSSNSSLSSFDLTVPEGEYSTMNVFARLGYDVWTMDHENYGRSSGTGDPRVAEALADAELVHGEEVPTGTYLDMTANLPVVDPLQVQAPVMLVRGEHDGIASEEDLLDFFGKLPNPDRQFIVLPGAAHALVFGHNRHQLWHVVHAFLAMPPRRDL